MHLLVYINPGRDVEDLVHLQDLDNVRDVLPVVGLDELTQIKWLAHEQMDHFGLPRLPVTHDLGVIEIELGLAIIPVTAVLDEAGRELPEYRSLPNEVEYQDCQQ